MMITSDQKPFLFQALFTCKEVLKFTDPPSCLAENLIPKVIDICVSWSNFALWCLLLSSLCCFQEKRPQGGKRQRSSLSAIINKRIQDAVIEKNPKRHRKPHPTSKLDRRLCSICAKLNEGNVKAGIRMAVGDNMDADFTVDKSLPSSEISAGKHICL